MKIWKSVLITTVFVFSNNVKAALIDNDIITLDDVSGLEWLDLSETVGLSFTQALDTHRGDGWRYATNTEVSNLFQISFVGYYDTFSDGSSGYYANAYANQYSDVIAFQNLFGGIAFNSNFYSEGMYLDENNILRRMGASRGSYCCDTRVWSDHATANLSYYLTNAGSLNATYLVRDFATAVPVPAAIWLFGSGLIGIASFARRQK